MRRLAQRGRLPENLADLPLNLHNGVLTGRPPTTDISWSSNKHVCTSSRPPALTYARHLSNTCNSRIPCPDHAGFGEKREDAGTDTQPQKKLFPSQPPSRQSPCARTRALHEAVANQGMDPGSSASAVRQPKDGVHMSHLPPLAPKDDTVLTPLLAVALSEICDSLCRIPRCVEESSRVVTPG